MTFRQSYKDIITGIRFNSLYNLHHCFLTSQVRRTMATVPEGFSSVTEGSATILHEGNDVFYNKAQVVNRDISIAVLRWFSQSKAKEPPKRNKRKAGCTGIVQLPEGTPFKKGLKGISILEAMAASGLRAIRYAKEIPGVGQVVANDLDQGAVDAIKRNIEFNSVSDTVTAYKGDARLLMLQHPQTFCVVDIDPYGSPTELLDMAVQSVSDGGLMAVTATDMAVLCGNNAESCFTKYGCYSLHRDYNHEQALRILLACLAMHAARHKRVIEPILCLSIDFYIRVFVRVRISAADSKSTASKLSYLWQSSGCDSWWLQPAGTHTSNKFTVGKGPPMPQACPISGSKFLMGGPIWSEPLIKTDAVKHIFDDIQANRDMFASHVKTCGMLRAVLEELPEVPLYYTLPSLTRTLKCEGPKLVTIGNALMNAGYRVSNTHCNPSGFKTDAPPEIVWDILRCWARKVGTKSKEPESYQAKILAVEPTYQANFAKADGQFSKARAANEPRFVQNPDNWGPRPKHGRPMLKHELEAAAEPDSKKAKTS